MKLGGRMRGELKAGGDGDRGSSSCSSIEFSLMTLLRLMLPPNPKLLMLPPPLLLRGLELANIASPPLPPRLGMPNTSGGRDTGGRGRSGEAQRRSREQQELEGLAW
ncbi:unnamed protein product [Pleuronectes platessa]|uniref:Uncharacterized protein n=1 Tax=Pleuronectes platessa TaxID=8262 RepID=A0A9N7U9X1_PLEPL|nr:unnamed protein product [Pleuronectes platessa]